MFHCVLHLHSYFVWCLVQGGKGVLDLLGLSWLKKVHAVPEKKTFSAVSESKQSKTKTISLKKPKRSEELRETTELGDSNLWVWPFS